MEIVFIDFADIREAEGAANHDFFWFSRIYGDANFGMTEVVLLLSRIEIRLFILLESALYSHSSESDHGDE